jgi:putative ABC transport system permease protein
VIRPGIRRLLRLPWPGRERVDAETEEEMRLHLELRAERLEREGMSAEAARREAARRFGPPEEARRELRRAARQREERARAGDRLGAVAQDVRHAGRRLLRAPGFTLVAVLTLALGIGANSAMFSVVNAVLLRPLPLEEPERLVRLFTVERAPTEVSGPDFMDFRAQARMLELAAMERESRTLTGAGEAERVRVGVVTPGFFELLRASPVLGRTFAEEEMEPGRHRVAVLSHGFWRQRFDADPGVVGRTVRLDGEEHEVVGVAPPGFDYPDERALWVPVVREGMFATSRRAVYLTVLGRLREGVTLERAEAEVGTIAARLEEAYPESNTGVGATLRPLREVVVGDTRRPLLVLLGAVGFVLLIACANVANLVLARAATREGEFAVRMALGAGKGRLVRHLLTESLLLGALGGAVGLLLAVGGTRLLVALGPEGIPRVETVGVDATVLAFTAGVALLTGVLFGLAPALQVRRASLGTLLRGGGRGAAGGRGNRVRAGLIVAETALAVVLLVGAGLLLRSFTGLVRVDPGIRSEGVLAFGLALPEARYAEEHRVRAFHADLLERLESIPGVGGAGSVLVLPLSGTSVSLGFAVAGRDPLPAGQRQTMQMRIASEGYFPAVGIPLVRGRSFTAQDREGSPPVVVLNEAAVRRFFPGEEPLGQRILLGWVRDSVPIGGEVVGIVGDVRHFGPGEEPPPEIYLPLSQVPNPAMNVVVRTTAADPLALAGAIRAELRALDPELAPGEIRPLDRVVSERVAQPRLYALLLSLFAAVALVLAAVGIFGVMSYSVAQRTREIGIRMALGAAAPAVQRLVVGRALLLTLAGLGLGTLGALALTRLLEGQLYGVAAADPATFLAAAALLAGVALLAGYLPARRATRVDPLVALRSE